MKIKFPCFVFFAFAGLLSACHPAQNLSGNTEVPKAKITKTILLVRHAKAESEGAQKADTDRVLEPQGQTDAAKIAAFLKAKYIEPEFVSCSSAQRTTQTAKIICNIIGYPEDRIKADQALYGCTPEVLIQTIRSLNNSYQTVMLVGHNPSTTAAANSLQTTQKLTEVPPGGVVAITFNVNDWNDVQAGNATLVFYQWPADLE